ncbi:potassium-transporting ATPase subunit C [Bifidobacterium callitrichos]|uniref:potassium-transporting ATPase subunit C n=1 Tax=Bifidobacterium callitrichos TaxID=762209 RepID=UPI002378A325|nr:potassium-transporting ATPase subunit C [Bifidobacterium callitrichos]
MTGVGQLGMPDKANGSMVTNSQGEVVGSSLIGQSFTDENGDALPQYFQSRPSAASDPNKEEDNQATTPPRRPAPTRATPTRTSSRARPSCARPSPSARA